MIDYKSRDPIYIQVKNRIIQDIVLGLLKKDQQLLPVRQLAGEIGVNPNTVQKAYRELEREGVIYSLPGRGSFVAAPQETVSSVEKQFQDELDDLIRRYYTGGVSAGRLRPLLEACLNTHPLLMSADSGRRPPVEAEAKPKGGDESGLPASQTKPLAAHQQEGEPL